MWDPNSKPSDDFLPVAYERWQAVVERGLKGASFGQRLRTRTLDGIGLEPLYTRQHWPGEHDQGGFAGLPPYRRGTQPQGRSGPHWDMRQRYCHPDPAHVREEIAADRRRGVGSVWLVFDSGLAHGKAPAGDGIVCNSVDDMGELLSELSIDDTAIALEPAGADAALASMLAAALARRGLSTANLRGTLGADPLGVLARTGSLPVSVPGSERCLSALAAWAEADAPNCRAVSIATAPYHDAGASAAQEIGAALAAGVAYLRWLTSAGMSVDGAAGQIQFSVSVGADFFGEIAKLRALRQTWAAVVAACGGGDEVQRAPIQARTSFRTKTTRDPWVNMLRATTETFAAAVGGADALATDPFDVAIGPADPFARRIAANAQVVLNEESHVARVADPAGGAFYVEALTDRLAEMGWACLQTIEAEGGLPASLLSGRLQKRIAAVASQRASDVARRKRPITGVSELANLEEEPVVRGAPSIPSIAASSPVRPVGHGAGLMRSAIMLATQGETVADISVGFAALEGSPCRVTALGQTRQAAPYEALRSRSDRQSEQHGQAPAVFLANLGPIPRHKARSTFATGFLHAGGITCIHNDGFSSTEDAVSAFARCGASAAALCGDDRQYEEWVEELAPRLQEAGATQILLAGRPGANEQRYRAAGITHFIYMGADLVASLNELLDRMGVES